jgi:YVTN family beta-propeller protein
MPRIMSFSDPGEIGLVTQLNDNTTPRDQETQGGGTRSRIRSMKQLIVGLLLLVAAPARADVLLVLNKADATLMIVDLASMKSVATIPVGEGPHEIAVSDDGKVAVGVNYGTGPHPGSTLSVIDVAGRKERRVTLPGLLRPHGIVAAGSHFYFTAEGSRAVARFDPSTDHVDWIGGTGQDVTHMLVVKGTKVYTANIGSDTVSVLDLANAPRQIALKQVAVVKGPEGIDLSPDGSELWVASRVPNGGINIIDPKSDTVIRTIPTTTTFANRVKFTPDGKRVLVSDTTAARLLVFDAATKELLKTIETAAGPAGVQLAPDGSRVFVACSNARQVQVIDLKSLEVTGSIETGNTPDGLAYARTAR